MPLGGAEVQGLGSVWHLEEAVQWSRNQGGRIEVAIWLEVRLGAVAAAVLVEIEVAVVATDGDGGMDPDQPKTGSAHLK